MQHIYTCASEATLACCSVHVSSLAVSGFAVSLMSDSLACVLHRNRLHCVRCGAVTTGLQRNHPCKHNCASGAKPDCQMHLQGAKLLCIICRAVTTRLRVNHCCQRCTHKHLCRYKPNHQVCYAGDGLHFITSMAISASPQLTETVSTFVLADTNPTAKHAVRDLKCTM